ncbi:N-acetylmuramic acid 6-phosphate etherase [Paenibacillus psychroresistens]|uniref:N-acetylmuramic acid 6-phosphate etherase n=1 Tax=Paenibacillus psychroresistens TaxID=1778678 RepID=A0A6B8RER1_9BACL|nr:N-acetylmuramic acid 6-phosphate etherase [Paenibacillus psychroresistens]QGQ94214.1 N-acetylmuramic acid 6-phosphate etherase [Paenibacillus psychroresistens]
MTQQIKQQPLTEQRNNKSQHLDRLSVHEIVTLMNEEDQTVALSVREALPQISIAIEAVVRAMKLGGRLYYIGAGTSGRLGVLDASECPPTFGVDTDLVNGLIAGGEKAIRAAIENAEDNAEAGARTIADIVREGDVVVGITANGAAPYVIGAIQEANRMGVTTIGISCNQDTPLSSTVQFPIEVLVGPEVITGSTRLKAGTAQKMVLNMISSTAMIQLGKVYGNLMVNMRATNKKLRERAIRVIQEATGADEETARRIGSEAKGDARVAILMIMFGISQQKAAGMLVLAQDHFGEAVKLLEQSRI